MRKSGMRIGKRLWLGFGILCALIAVVTGTIIFEALEVNRAADRMILRQITDEVMYEIRNLSGQEYVDSYAGKGDAPIVAVVPTGDGVAPVVALPERVEQRSERVVIASAAASRSTPVASLEADGVERRSSSAAIRSRPLDLGFELELSSA